MGSVDQDDIYEVVISGIGGSFPESDNVDEFKKHLFEKTNLVTENHGKWNPDAWQDISKAVGKISNLKTIDNTFFGLLRSTTMHMDPLVRITLEKAFEAFIDAGVNPFTLYGTNTSVYATANFSEAGATSIASAFHTKTSAWLLAFAQTFLSNRISNFLNFYGPSLTMISTWNGGLEALRLAYNDVRKGRAKQALVIGANVVLYPEIMRLINQTGMQSKNGQTRSFDANAEGYGRSDGTVALFLQRAENAKKDYGKIIHVDINCGNTYTRNLLAVNPDAFEQFLERFYSKCGVSPSDVSYMETYGCAVPAFDEIELNVSAKVFCKSRVGNPLKIGSVKSNAGHAEGSSVFFSIVKALISLDSGLIPPNVHFQTPNPNIPALTDGRLKVVTEASELDGDYVAVNNFCYVGGLGHILLKRRKKYSTKIISTKTSIPRLIFITARTETGLFDVISKIESGPYSSEFHDLIQTTFSKGISGHFYRGYTILPTETPSPVHGSLEQESMKRPVWIVCTGMGCQWVGMAQNLMGIPVFGESLRECAAILKPFDIDLIHIVTSDDRSIFDNIIYSFVGITAVQIGLVDLLYSLGVEVDGMIGHSLGETSCAYADGGFTKKQALICSYFRGKCSVDVPAVEGLMVAVGADYKLLHDLPSTIIVGCRNSSTSCTLSGPAEDIRSYCELLKDRKVFHRIVSTGKLAYHSPYIRNIGEEFKRRFQSYVPNPKLRSSRWISTSVPEKDWSLERARYSSAEYMYNNFINCVLFDTAISRIPENAIIIEIAPHGLLQSILTKALPPTCFNIPLLKRGTGNQAYILLSSIGKLFTSGLTLNLDVLYPPPEYPIVSCVPSMASLMSWDHTDQWIVPDLKICWTAVIEVNMKSNSFNFLYNHKVENSIILPTAFVLVRLMEELCKRRCLSLFSSQVVYENVVIHENLILDDVNAEIGISIRVNNTDGCFELCGPNDTPLLSGCVSVHKLNKENEDDDNKWYTENINKFFHLNSLQKTNLCFDKSDVYTIFENAGIYHGQPFDLIEKLVINEYECLASVRWTEDLIGFFDAIFKIFVVLDILHNFNFSPLLPSNLLNLTINLSALENTPKGSFIPVFIDLRTRSVQTKGITLFKIENAPLPNLTNENSKIQLKTVQMFPHNYPSNQSLEKFTAFCLQLLSEALTPDWFSEETFITVLGLKNSDVVNDLLKIVESASINLNNIYVDLKTVDPLDAIPSVINQNSLVLDDGRILTSVFKKFQSGFLLASLPAQEKLFIDANTSLLAEVVLESRKYVLLRKATCSQNVKVQKMDACDLHQISGIKTATSDGHDFVLVWENPKDFDLVGVVLQAKKLQILKQPFRFFFILDSGVRSFSLNDPFYYQQLKCGLVINILEDGQWWSLNSVEMLHRDSFMDQRTFPSLSFNCTSESLYEKIRVFSINIKDMTIDHNSERESELGAVDYVGLTKTNERIMGLAYFNSADSSLSHDSILKWPAPENMSDENAATLPYHYSLAYYVLKIVPKVGIKKKPILIHAGNSALGFAAISVAIDLESNIFVSVNNEKEASFLLEQFPQLNQHQILLTDNTLEHKILRMTNGKGVSVLLNPYCGKMVQASCSLMGPFGCLIQLGNLDLKNREKLGMSNFFGNVTFYGLPNFDFASCSTSIKVEIHHFITEKLKAGTLKPLPKSVFGIDEETAIFKYLTEKNQGGKAVISMSKLSSPCSVKEGEKSKAPYFLCQAEKTYLIIASKDSMWLQIVMWLLRRSARKIVIALSGDVLKKSLEHQLHMLIQRFNQVSFLLLLDADVKTEAGTRDIFKQTLNLGALEIIFCLALDKSKLLNVDAVSRQLSPSAPCFISLLSDAEELCQTRSLNKFPSLCVQTSTLKKQFNYIVPYLDEIISHTSSKKRNLDSSTVSIDRRGCKFQKSGNYNFLLPISVQDLVDLSFELQPHAVFQEVTTKSCRSKYVREIEPVFFIPGHSIKSFQQLFEKLNHPAFCAPPLFYPESIESTVSDLFQALKTLKPTGPYTIVAETWSNCILVELASLLEKNGDQVKIILIGGSPDSVKHLLSDLKARIKHNHKNWLAKLLDFENIHSDLAAEQIISSSPNEITEENKTRIRNSVRCIHRKLLLAQNYETRADKLKGDVLIVELNKPTSEINSSSIQELSSKQEVFYSSETNYESFLKGSNIPHFINDCVLSKLF